MKQWDGGWEGTVVLTNGVTALPPPRSDAAWADISGSVEERKQHLEQSNKNLDVFQTTELQLAQWLSEKELMMSVLGPLSIDPNMLKMQKQQVQVNHGRHVRLLKLTLNAWMEHLFLFSTVNFEAMRH